MNKDKWKKLLKYIIYALLWAVVIALLIPILSESCYNGYLSFKELNGTISASEKSYLEEQREFAYKYWW